MENGEWKMESANYANYTHDTYAGVRQAQMNTNKRNGEWKMENGEWGY